MRRSINALFIGLLLLVGALAFDLLGEYLQLLALTVFSFILAIGGAVVAVRGMFEFLAERAQ